jgi:SAM-dependent methyltransferase
MATHVCPWWLGYLHASAIRRLVEKPERLVGPYLEEGMTVLDVGCGMGFFTLPMARIVGPSGKVVAVDLQARMLSGLRRRALKAGLADRIVSRLCEPESLGLDEYQGTIDFALAFAVVHEVSNKERLFAELRQAVARHGRLLVAEPPGRVSADDFRITLAAAGRNGFAVLEHPTVRGKADRSALLSQNPSFLTLDLSPAQGEGRHDRGTVCT